MAATDARVMDFFAGQEHARRRTGLLVGLYVLAVLLIIASVYVALMALLVGLPTHLDVEIPALPITNLTLLGSVAGVVLLIVLTGSAYKTTQLARGGGASVARLLGGHPVSANTTALEERKLLNVVEEMAIASGVPAPPVFVMEGEEGINAFAAGFTTGDAVIAVTRGTLDTLSRDELQGVIAHEFSHILNGDMRLNIRLMGILHGILVLGMLGYLLMRIGLAGGHQRSRSNRKGNALPIAAFGLVVMAVGYIGVFFGNLIKSAVSRQREFLADASAVQFTRNPRGIGGALARIAGLRVGSRLRHDHAREASHFLFADGQESRFVALFATHPPLAERIRRIDASLLLEAQPARPKSPPDAASASTQPPPSPLPPQTAGFHVTPAAILSTAGTLSPAHVTEARRLLNSIPAGLRQQAQEPVGAQAILYALLLDPHPERRARQVAILQSECPPSILDAVEAVAPVIGAFDRSQRLPMADLCLAALRELAPEPLETFTRTTRRLVEADGALDLFEYTLQHMLERRLRVDKRPAAAAAIRIRHMHQALSPVTALLSSLANWGADDTETARQAFQSGYRELLIGPAASATMLDPAACGLETIDQALTALALAAPLLKRRILTACLACVTHDGHITADEAELIRAMADALDCPLPPLLPGEGTDNLEGEEGGTIRQSRHIA